jgi:ferredoxin
VSVDEDKCCASGLCVLAVPQVFDQQDENGIVILLRPDPPQERRAEVRRAAGFCPASAIRIH